jgi:nucleoid-associated protein YgaU
MEDQEARNVLVQKARAAESEGDSDTAIRLYTEAIEKNSNLVRAHLDLAILLQDCAKDYAGAIEHYNRYLELRPETEKMLMIKEKTKLARKMLASNAAPSEVTRPLRYKLSAGGPNKPLVDRFHVAGSNSADTTSNDSRRTYIVKEGDSLSSIAAEVYQDRAMWRSIADANRSSLGESNRLRIGQVLVIP